MTEKELRQQVADWGNAYKGISEGSTAHKELINMFNNSGLCPRYKMTTNDPWCALFASDAFIACGLTNIFPCVECSCAEMVSLAKKAGIWVEDDSYTPGIGDVIMYDWDDSGSGDNTGTPDHVGIVQKVSGSSITVIEGNKSDTVGTRSMTVNGKYIRGYITPNYVSAASSTTSTSNSGKSDATVDPKVVWDSLMGWIGNAYGVAGFMGNIKAESAFIPINLQDSYESKLGYTDQSYTDAVDSGKYSKFSKDSAGYGLCQWTYSTRKKALKSYCDNLGASIGNASAQLGFLQQEVESDYSSMLKTLKNAASVKEASDAVLTKFEMPADQSDSVKTKRAEYGQTYYDQYAESASSTASKTIEELAQEVMAGKWGNNPERAQALTAAGYDAEAVQALVDKIYGVGGSSGMDPNGIAYADKQESGYSGGKTYKVNTASGLNMRTGPSKSYSVIKALPNGTSMTYYGYYTNTNGVKWMLVISGGTTGWVCSTYVKKA